LAGLRRPVLTRLSPDVVLLEARPSDVGKRSVRGTGVSFLAQAARFALQAASMVVLARLLTPDDYGIVAMALVVIGLAQVFRDAGLSTATVQRDQLTRAQVDSLFWINLAVSAAITAAVLVSAPLVAAFYRTPELTAVTAWLSATFLISGVSIQQDALLRRYMQFGSLAAVQIASQSVTFAVAVMLALLGYGYWSLVAGSLCGALASTVLTVYLCPLLPRRPHRGAGVRDMLVFGGRVTAFDFVNYFARTSDNIVVGRFIGADALGLYSRAYNLFMLPITQIRAPLSQVALPAMSALHTEPAQYRQFYTRMLEAMAVLTVPLGVYCLFQGAFVVRVLLGPQWIQMTATFRILAIAGILQACVSTVGLVLVSLGRPDRQLRLGIANTLVVLAGILLGVPYGIEGVATGYVIANYLIFLPTLRYSYAGSPLRVTDFMRTVAPALAASGAAAVVGFGTSMLLPDQSVAGGFLVLVVFGLVYSGVILSRSSVRASLRLLVRRSQPEAS
jgi:polysaccharide transporter, PST family